MRDIACWRLDVDGTLLDPDGTLRPRTAEAVARRRGRASSPSFARAGAIGAPGRSPSNSAWTHRWCATRGPSSRTRPTIARSVRADFDPELAADVLDFSAATISLSVVFTDRDPDDFDFIIPASPRPGAFDDYVAKNLEHAEIDSDWPTAGPRRGLAATSRCSMSAPSGLEEMLAFERAALDRVAGRVQTFVLRTSRYLGTMCEIFASMPASGPPSSTWPGSGASPGGDLRRGG